MSVFVKVAGDFGASSGRSTAAPPWQGVARARFTSAFTLVEILLVVGAIASLSAAAIFVVQGVSESSRVAKLESDVATLNSAIQVYRASGGTLPSSATPQAILNKLKTSASSGSASAIAGLRGSMVDLRLVAEMQTAPQAASSRTRALWVAAESRFTLATTGASGVHFFRLDDMLAGTNPGTETRTPTLELADNGGWIWDYTDRDPTLGAASGSGPSTGTAPGSTPPTAPTALDLNPPLFSQEGGIFALINYDLAVTLSNPNPAGTSQIVYSINSAPYTLYTGETIIVQPGDNIRAYAATSDPDHWTDSGIQSHTYSVIPIDLVVAASAAPGQLTYETAGGAMADTPVTLPAPVTFTVTNAADIPPAYRNSSQFQLVWTLDGSDPLSSETAMQAGSFSANIPTPSIDISVEHWPTNATQLIVRAAAKAINTDLFASSPVVETSTEITPTSLATPVIDPPSGMKAVDLPVSIAMASSQAYPVGARIYYTTDGTDPGNVGGNPVNGTLYNGQFNSGSGTNGAVVVMARVYGPVEYAQWFTPSTAAENTYSTITLAEGALVGSANLNGTFVGSLIYAAPPPGGSMSNITFNSNARILSGNLYLPGTPTIRRTNGTIWSLANDSLFSSNIQGWEFDAAGTKTVQTTPRVLNEDGSITPDNYSVTFNNSAVLEGKVIRRHDSPAFPTIPAPPPPDSSGTASLNSPPPGPIDASQYSTVTLNSSGVGDVRLNAGNYANLTANNGTAFVLGDPLNPEVTQFYSFQSLTLNSASDLKIVGKVIVTVGNSITTNSGSVLGNAAHPEWLQLQFSAGSLTANSGSTIYGQLVTPTGSVTFNAGSTFTGSVTASSLTINSSSVVFNLPPVIEN